LQRIIQELDSEEEKAEDTPPIQSAGPSISMLMRRSVSTFEDTLVIDDDDEEEDTDVFGSVDVFSLMKESTASVTVTKRGDNEVESIKYVRPVCAEIPTRVTLY
jgi:hypothetical protein